MPLKVPLKPPLNIPPQIRFNDALKDAPEEYKVRSMFRRSWRGGNDMRSGGGGGGDIAPGAL